MSFFFELISVIADGIIISLLISGFYSALKKESIDRD